MPKPEPEKIREDLEHVYIDGKRGSYRYTQEDYRNAVWDYEGDVDPDVSRPVRGCMSWLQGKHPDVWKKLQEIKHANVATPRSLAIYADECLRTRWKKALERHARSGKDFTTSDLFKIERLYIFRVVVLDTWADWKSETKKPDNSIPFPTTTEGSDGRMVGGA